MKILKHYTTKGGKYEIKAILTDDSKINIEHYINGNLQGAVCNRVYLDGIFLFKSLVVAAKSIDGINYCNKLIDILH